MPPGLLDSSGMVLRIFIEVKRWKDRVGINMINEVLGAMFTERERLGWHAGIIVSTGGFIRNGRFSTPELSLKGLELRAKEDLLLWLDNYRPNKNGLWLPAPERTLPITP
jgi:Restriction endonuclease